MPTVDLPDFEDMMNLAQQIGQLTKDKLSLKAKIELLEGETVRIVSTDEKYFSPDSKGVLKPPATNYIQAVYCPAGIDEKIVPLREEYATVCGELEYSQLKFEILRAKLEVWKTQIYNEGRTTL